MMRAPRTRGQAPDREHLGLADRRAARARARRARGEDDALRGRAVEFRARVRLGDERRRGWRCWRRWGSKGWGRELKISGSVSQTLICHPRIVAAWFGVFLVLLSHIPISQEFSNQVSLIHEYSFYLARRLPKTYIAKNPVGFLEWLSLYNPDDDAKSIHGLEQLCAETEMRCQADRANHPDANEIGSPECVPSVGPPIQGACFFVPRGTSVDCARVLPDHRSIS
jgi:hypothetical protein